MYKKSSGFINGRPLAGWSKRKHNWGNKPDYENPKVRLIGAEEIRKINKKFKDKKHLTKEETERLLKEYYEKNK